MKALVIVDFNLTRFDDVKLMTDYVKEHYGLASVLIRPNPGKEESTIAEHVIDLDPLAPGFVEQATRAIARIGVEPAAILPFSDNSVRTGAQLAEHFGLLGDSSVLAENAFSKEAYRYSEKAIADLCRAQGIVVPEGTVIRNLYDLCKFAIRCPGGFVLKPSCEGNNRGVIKLTLKDNLEEAWEEVKKYQVAGIVCEEWIALPEECSFDGIGHLTFMTQKVSRIDRYPVEQGQIVPARFSPEVAASVQRAGRVANLLSGQRIGPFHNEIKFDPSSLQSAVIEPNRRPAGMKIWHLANKVYGVNFFHLWIDQLLKGALPAKLPEPKGAAGIRMLPAPRDGWIEFGTNKTNLENKLMKAITQELPAGIEWFDFKITVTDGSEVSAVQKDNSGFIAQICAYSPFSETDINSILDQFEDKWTRLISNYIAADRKAKAV